MEGLPGACCLLLAPPPGPRPPLPPPPPPPPPLPQVKAGYFQGLIDAARITEADLPQCLFASKPASGGAILAGLQL